MAREYGHYIDEPVASGPSAVRVREGEDFRRLFVIRPGAEAVLPFDTVVAEAGTKVDICVIVMPGVDAEIPLNVDILGSGADVSLEGIYICGGSEKVSFRTMVRHRMPECTSNQLFNGIAGGNAGTGFYGRIIVAPDAQKTEAYQSNHNILLDRTATVATDPQLEIYADDVKCSHGATVGSLNEDEQFYMRSRGIPEAEAKVLQMVSFVAPVLDHIADLAEKKSLAAEIEENIRKIV